MSVMRVKKRSASLSLSQQAYDLIRNGILRGQFPMGAPLSRRQLASQLGTSFLPVSEALQRLESEGLVESRPRVGTRVRVPTSQDIRGHYVIREALESQSARLFAEKASSQEREELRRMAERLDQVYANPAGNLFEAFSFHERFHRRIAECTGCPALSEAIEKNHILIFNWLYMSASHFSKLPSRWHQSLIEVLAKGDRGKADQKMREHVTYGMEEVLRRLEPVLGWNGSRILAFTKPRLKK
jgi:GntR family transcriptional regulator, rspAB operon transcriptional repressor